MQKRNIVTIIIALLGSLKLVLSAFGIDIDDATIATLSNGVAAAATVIGVVMTHIKPELSKPTAGEDQPDTK